MLKYRALVGSIILTILIIAITSKVAAPLWQHPAAPHSNGNTAPIFDKHAYSTGDPASIWVVVNKQHPLNPKTYAPPDLIPVGNGQYLRAEAAQALSKMISAAKIAGYVVTPESGYRSYGTQVAVYANEVKAYGQATADSESARPGYSEHQTGWAIDLGSGGCNIQDCFATTSGGEWAAANAYKYGFLLRYPANLTSITGYRAEAWHFRYIGVPLASELNKEHVATLEQFFDISGGTTYK